NAHDAMPDGGGLIISTANIVIDDDSAVAIPAGIYVVLSVRDTGFGMDEAVRNRIFEPFFSTKTRDKGPGLGLSMVYGIARQSGGAITVDSEPGVGTQFRIYFPAHAAGETAPSYAVPVGKGASQR